MEINDIIRKLRVKEIILIGKKAKISSCRKSFYIPRSAYVRSNRLFSYVNILFRKTNPNTSRKSLRQD